jgi:predicted esterase
MAPYASVTRLAQALAAAGADVESFEWNGGHGITRDELLSAREWLAGVAASR